MAASCIAAPNDTQHNGFTQVPNAILKDTTLSVDARMLYSILLSYCWQKGFCFPSYDTLMRDMQCHSQALRSYIKELITHGLITVVRRGQGKSNQYVLSHRITADTPEPVSTQAGREEPSSANITEPVLCPSQPEEYITQKDEEKDPSKIRTAKKEETDYVNPMGTAVNAYGVEQQRTQEPSEDPTQERAGENNKRKDGISEERRRPSNHQNTSKPSGAHEIKLTCEETHKVAKGSVSASDLTSHDDEARQAIRDYIRDIRSKLHDEAPLESSTTRAFRLYQRADIDLSSFFNRLYDAETATNQRHTTIKKRRADGFINRMAYFFAVLEDKLHLRSTGLSDSPQTA